MWVACGCCPTRRKAFVRKYGDIAVELDALPVQVLRQRLVDEVEARTDMDALERTWQIEEADRERLAVMLASGGESGRE